MDYNETFAPAARISSFRFIIAFANQFNLLIHHMDVKTAFLNGILKEEMYMRVPDGVKCNANQVCKLNKALYGLEEVARCWFETFEKVLIEKGFQNSSVDRCIYLSDRGDISKNIYKVRSKINETFVIKNFLVAPSVNVVVRWKVICLPDFQ